MSNTKDGSNLSGLILARRRRRRLSNDLLIKASPGDAAPAVFGDWLFDKTVEVSWVELELPPGSAAPTSYDLAADAGAYTLTGSAATLKATRKLAAAAGSYSVTGSDATLKPARKLAAAAGSYSVTGSAATLAVTRKIAADAGAYNVTGTAANLVAGRKLAAGAGSYSITGSAASLTIARQFKADAGSYAVTGSAANLVTARKLAAAGGSYAITGSDATLAYSGGAGSWQVSWAELETPARWAVSWVEFETPPASGTTSYDLAAGSGSYVITGADATLTYVQASGTNLSVAGDGTAQNLIRRRESGYSLDAGSGAYTVTGSPATLSVARQLAAGSGSYAITGSDATFSRPVSVSWVEFETPPGVANNRFLAADSGAYVLTGFDAGFALGTAGGTNLAVAGDASAQNFVRRREEGQEETRPITGYQGTYLRDYPRKKVAEVIAEVAAKQVAAPHRNGRYRLRQLEHELAKAELAWDAFYAELLAQARDKLLTEQIRAEFQAAELQQAYDEALMYEQVLAFIDQQLALAQMEQDDDDAIALLLLNM